MQSLFLSVDLSADEFLRVYWQKKPLLIRNAFPGVKTPVSAEELAGLACETEVNSRLVIEKDAERPWSVQYGPFDESDFQKLPSSHWTLLVSDVEKLIPETQFIKQAFSFIPDWRIDDLMFSYAPEAGSVGPHVDAYDVFLLQTQGRRRWQISSNYTESFLDNTDLKILSEFSHEQEWILEPGDMLYLPPGVAHHGVALDDCITCSIGFRAPSARALVSEYAEALANTLADDIRYTDPDLEPQEHSAEISPASLEKIRAMLLEQLVIDDDFIKHWFGDYMTDIRSNALLIDQSDTAADDCVHTVSDYKKLLTLLTKTRQLSQHPASRILYIRDKDTALVFANGEHYATSLKFAETLCQHRSMNIDVIMNTATSGQDQHALTELYNKGCLYISDGASNENS